VEPPLNGEHQEERHDQQAMPFFLEEQVKIDIS